MLPASSPSLHNPDFVNVVILSDRHRYGLEPGDPRYDDRDFFTGPYEYRLLANAGHNVPQEDPDSFAEAVCTLLT